MKTELSDHLKNIIETYKKATKYKINYSTFIVNDFSWFKKERRWNGWQKIYGLLEFKSEHRTMKCEFKKLELNVKKFEEHKKYILELNKLMNQLVNCPKCKGNQGEFSKDFSHRNWMDCSECEGHGIILKNKKQTNEI